MNAFFRTAAVSPAGLMTMCSSSCGFRPVFSAARSPSGVVPSDGFVTRCTPSCCSNPCPFPGDVPQNLAQTCPSLDRFLATVCQHCAGAGQNGCRRWPRLSRPLPESMEFRPTSTRSGRDCTEFDRTRGKLDRCRPGSDQNVGAKLEPAWSQLWLTSATSTNIDRPRPRSLN